MKKMFLAALSVALVMAFAACSDKEGSADSELDAFVGTYSLTIETDSVQNNGTWFSNSILPEGTRVPTRSGRLTITPSKTSGKVDVLGRIDIAGDSVDYYRTTGSLDDQGRLQLESGKDYQATTRVQHYSFQPITKGNTATFKVDASYQFNGAPFVERSTNTIKKR